MGIRIIPCHSKCRHQCGREQWRGSWFGPHRPAAEPPARPRSPEAYWVPRPPPLFIQLHQNRSNNQNHTHFWVFTYTSIYIERESTFAGDDLTLSSHGRKVWEQSRKRREWVSRDLRLEMRVRGPLLMIYIYIYTSLIIRSFAKGKQSGLCLIIA